MPTTPAALKSLYLDGDSIEDITYINTMQEMRNNINSWVSDDEYEIETTDDIIDGLGIETAYDKLDGDGINDGNLSKIFEYTSPEYGSPGTEYNKLDLVMKVMSRRYFPDSGDNLMFLDNHIYSMAGTKVITDEEFFEFLQAEMISNMILQMVATSFTAFFRARAAEIGLSATSGNPLNEFSTSMVSSIETIILNCIKH